MRNVEWKPLEFSFRIPIPHSAIHEGAVTPHSKSNQRQSPMRKYVKYAILIVFVFLIAAQFIRPVLTNPPVNPAMTFESAAHARPETLAVVKRACIDCHSNETVWPWYSHVAPASWLVADDVKEGRSHLNFSEWGFYSPEMSKLRLKEACSEVRKGDMPPLQYKLIHGAARLSPADVEAICNPFPTAAY